jgi:hypothetical protein
MLFAVITLMCLTAFLFGLFLGRSSANKELRAVYHKLHAQRLGVE